MKLKHIATQLSGHGTALYTRPWAWVQTRLWNPVSNLLVSCFHKSPNAINRRSLSVPTESNSKAYPANQTTAAQSTKQGRIIARAKASQTGLQRQTTARQTHRLVTTAFKKIKELVALTKLEVLHINASKTVLILTVSQWIQAGLKSLGPVNQLRLVAFLLHRWGQVRVALTKKALLIFKKPIAVLTRMGHLLKGRGWKYQEPANQHRPRAKQRRSKGS